MESKRQKIIEDTLHFVSNKGWTEHGESFLDQLAQFLGTSLDIDYVLIDKYSKDSPLHAETLAVFNRNNFLPNITYELRNTPCANVVAGRLCCYETNIQTLFPEDDLLKQMNVDSYIAIPLWGSNGDPIGLIAMMDRQALVDIKTFELCLQIVAIKAAHELEKTLYENELKIQNEELMATNEELIATTDALKDSNDELQAAKEKVELNEYHLKLKNEEYETINEELRQANDELIVSKNKAEESERLKTAFLQNMSHEIRTPMNAIIGFSDFLSKRELSETKRNSFISIIQNSSQQLLSIVTNVLTISSLETKQERINVAEVCVNDIVVDLLTIFREQSKSKNLLLYAKQPLSNNQSLVYTDKTKLTQILTNLLTNALKFTHNGSIEFGYELKKEFLEFYVKDSGIGIPKDLTHIIFERFRQADNLIHQNYGGTGLGLSISKGFVELLGGHIWVESEINKGSTFYFSIPYDPVETANQASSPLKQNENFRTILVAEDLEYNFLFIEELLIEMDYKLIHAKNGEETVDICKTNPAISLVLMDIKMPIMDGYTAAKIIKESHPSLPIIAQSAYAMEQEKEKYQGCAFDDYITKPIDGDELKKKIVNWTQSK